MAWMETDYSKDMYFQWKIKQRLELLGTLGVMGEMAPLIIANKQTNKQNLTWNVSK